MLYSCTDEMAIMQSDSFISCTYSLDIVYLIISIVVVIIVITLGGNILCVFSRTVLNQLLTIYITLVKTRIY